MFKKIMVSVVSASIFMAGMPAVSAAPFGKSSSSSRSSSSSVSRPSSSGGSFGSRSTAPSSSNSSASYGGISQGKSVGMTRSDVSGRVRSGTNVAPANETTVAGRNPGGNNSNSSPSYAGSNNSGYNGGSSYNNGGYNNNNNAPARTGHSTGALVGAAAAGAIGGYMLNGMMHNRDGSVYNGAGYNNGVPIQGYNNAPAQGYNNASAQGYNNGGQPTVNYNNGYAAAPAHSGGSFWYSLFWFLLVVALVVFLWKMFFSKKNSNDEGVSMFGNNANTKSPEAELRDNKEQMFIDFQKNNKPSGLRYIQSNTTPMMYEAMKEPVSQGSDSRTCTVQTLEARLEDITQEGSSYIGSVSYRGNVVEQEPGQKAVVTAINEIWHFKHTDGGWKLAGIEEL